MATIAVVAVLLVSLAWFFGPAAAPPRRIVDNAELEAAERDVQEAADPESVKDWGPGTGQKPLP
jgi:hypothetical protein